MDKSELEPPWWHAPLHAAGALAGLLVLSAGLMAFILFVARFFDTSGTSGVVAPVFITTTPATPPGQDNARTRPPPPYGPFTLPNSPGRPAATSFSSNPRYSASGAAPVGEPAKPEPPVGLSVDEYRAAVESGRKVYLPNPKGECDLSGESTAKSANSLENCFAQRAAR